MACVSKPRSAPGSPRTLQPKRWPCLHLRPAALPEAAVLAAQLQQAHWQLEALHTLIDQAEAAYRIAIRKKAGAKPSK